MCEVKPLFASIFLFSVLNFLAVPRLEWRQPELNRQKGIPISTNHFIIHIHKDIQIFCHNFTLISGDTFDTLILESFGLWFIQVGF